MAKLVTDAVLKKNIEDILTELVNSTYQWEEYTDEEVGNLVELDPTQVAELSAVISDTQVAKNKVFSSFHTKELLQENIIEANKYADDLVANLANIKLDIVDALPDSTTVNKSTIYILKDSSGGTNNTLNVWSDTTSAFVEVGKLSVNMDNYYTKSEVDAELDKKANADEVLKPDAIVSDLTTTSGSTTLSTAGLQTELDKKANDDEVVKTIDIATTIDSASTDTQVASAKVVYDNAIKNKSLKTYTSLSQLGLTTPTTVGEIFNAIPDDGSLAVIKCGELANSVTDVPNSFGLLTIEKGGDSRFSILFKHSLNGSAAPDLLYTGQLKGSDGSGLTWRRVCTTKVADVEKLTNSFIDTNVSGSVAYVVKNGICTVKFWPIKSTTTGLGKKLLDNLPLPKDGDIGTSLNEANGDGSVTAFSYVNSDGNLFVHFYKDNSEAFGTFSYPVAES